ncbi:hypothetical protein NDU88_005912 [Pleurodeles waltl]|uniref:Uncharacterized protein n=1 Tax=Pleurodeles waltl TaxID=8319 RepID=A0AAV7WW27_PLEWA|nr:hypothetical protein NDU88_005912 [Pleurodeles waltl]
MVTTCDGELDPVNEDEGSGRQKGAPGGTTRSCACRRRQKEDERAGRGEEAGREEGEDAGREEKEDAVKKDENETGEQQSMALNWLDERAFVRTKGRAVFSSAMGMEVQQRHLRATGLMVAAK